MPRNGVDYEAIKQTAIKLLSQGIAPSVQKIREMLGTGSNTTIAEHLKVWREEYANKAIHHLPSTMPKELISTIEVLWQTAMDQASQQLGSIKHGLMEEQEKLRLEKLAMEKTESDFRARFSQAQKQIDEKNSHIQSLQINLVVAEEKLKQQANELQSMKTQYEAHLKRAYDDKNTEVDNNQKLMANIEQLKQKLNEQIEKNQTMLNEERVSQEESEKRWIKLIDQARTETKEQRKQFENIIEKQIKQLENHQSMLSELRQKQVAQQSTINQKNERIAELSAQCSQAQGQYQKATATIAVLQERLNHFNKEQKEQRKLKSQKQLQMVRQA